MDRRGDTAFARDLREASFVGEVWVSEVRARRGVMGRARVEAIWSDVEAHVGRTVVDRWDRPDRARLGFTLLGGVMGQTSMRASESLLLGEGLHAIVFLRREPAAEPQRARVTTFLRIEDDRVLTHDRAPVVEIDEAGIRVGEARGTIEIVALGSSQVRPSGEGRASAPMTTDAALSALRGVIGGVP